jgi:hypothetical protein
MDLPRRGAFSKEVVDTSAEGLSMIGQGIGKTSCVFGTSDRYGSVKLEPMRD